MLLSTFLISGIEGILRNKSLNQKLHSKFIFYVVFSNNTAIPCPPPIHAEPMPYFPPQRLQTITLVKLNFRIPFKISRKS